MQHDCWENEYGETSVLLGITAGGAPVPCDGAIPISIRIFEGLANHLSKSVNNKRMGLAIIESDDGSAFSNFEMGSSSTFLIGNYKIREISFCFSTSPLQTSATYSIWSEPDLNKTLTSCVNFCTNEIKQKRTSSFSPKSNKIPRAHASMHNLTKHKKNFYRFRQTCVIR
jgi:hypothetical protein